MKGIIFLIFLFFSVHTIHAQKTSFLRIYNSKGKKISKGRIFQLSDTSITLTRKNRFVETPVAEINTIKSKRTTGHRILITTLSVVSVVAILATVAQSNQRGPANINSSSKKTPNLPIMGKPAKPLKKYKVNNNLEDWQEQRKLLTFLLI